VINVSTPRFEHLREPLGIGVARPRLSWTVETDVPGWRQDAYEVTARGKTVAAESGESVLVEWPFEGLGSRERVSVGVRVRGTGGEWSGWAEAGVEAGLLEVGDWAARFVSPGGDRLVGTSFEVDGEVAAARLYASGLGVYEARVNGVVVGDHVLAPGWTAYRERVRYQTFDVTGMVRRGRNSLGALLGDGWFHGRLGFEGGRALYGDRVALLAQLEIRYADGRTARVVTDGGWRSLPGPVVASDLYDGESYDARREPPGWGTPDEDLSGGRPVEVVEWDLGTLVAPAGPPVRRTELVPPVEVLTSPSGRTIVDFGQNLVGRVRIAVDGAAGDTVTVRHAEVLQDGELCVRPLRTARATDTYVLRDGRQEWEPRFTFHGFRYAELSGPVDPAGVVAVVCHSDLTRTGWFECSEPLVNRLHENVVWSMRGNFLDVPTDCPQRDERLGWTGDLQVFSPTAAFLYDTAGLLTSWLADLAADQAPDGAVPEVVPDVLDHPPRPVAAWGDAAVVVPWVVYRRFGDAGVLADRFDSMRGWVDHVAGLAGPSRLWDSGFQYGDWLDPTAPPDDPFAATTAPALVATAYFARSAELVADSAAVLGRAAEEAHYRSLAQHVRRAFHDEYVTAAGRVLADTATGYALALRFALLPTPEQRARAGRRLAEVVAANGHRIATGFVGTPLICDALADAGELDTAYRLLLERECPSWLYPVTMGATTIWERWDSLLPDGTVNPGQMTSFNHYALGAVADWLHRTVAGLAPAAPGYRELRLRPRPGGGLTHAAARLITPYGPAACGWRLADGQITVDATVPPNTTASVVLPNGEEFGVGAGDHSWTRAY
jgi:alpha-L-rhamnosidase